MIERSHVRRGGIDEAQDLNGEAAAEIAGIIAGAESEIQNDW